MNDRYLILKFLIRNIKDDHLAVYIYSCGHERSKTTAINIVYKLINKIFSNIFNNNLIIETIKEYLEFKRHQYKTGEIMIKPKY
jgi:hypothetical protein